MEYCVVNKAQGDNNALNVVISQMLSSYSRQLFNFTKNEFDSLAEYDVLCILACFYSKMNAEQKDVIARSVGKLFSLKEAEDILENLSENVEEHIYVPLSCRLLDRLGDSRMTMIIYESIFSYCKKVIVDNWDIKNAYSNYLALLNAAFFNSLAYKLHVRESYRSCLNEYYHHASYEDLIEALYEENLDNLGWDAEVELDVLDNLIAEGKDNLSFDETAEEDYSAAVAAMEELRAERNYIFDEEDNKVTGFQAVVRKTGIKLHKTENIHGFECHFCGAKNGTDEYIIVYQRETRISKLIEKEDEWNKFQHDLYYADIKEDKSSGMVYIVYILDADSSNIPIQVIESNKTYGRKYVFTEEETVTFINGIVKTSHDEIGEASPVQEWDRILREEHLTGCMTEAFSNKKVDSYLAGARFDADYVMDDDYSAMSRSAIPQVKWVKSLETKGFRDFCFDDKTMEFGQINLFYGANGSGKTSVLEAIEYALTAEVRRVKDFKVKMPTTMYPKLRVYDHEAGVHTFYPERAKSNNKEIERVWYGVPVGRTKSNLNENFNRFNSFDSEAAYKFIHESDNSEETYASMFGNLMFGETVVDHEKKWQRYKKEFEKRYSELRTELNEARSMVEFYEQMLSQKSDASRADAVEQAIVALRFRLRMRLPKETSERYKKLLEELTLVRKYVDLLSAYPETEQSFSEIEARIAEVKSDNQRYIRERKEKSDQITSITEKSGEYKKLVFEEKEKFSGIEEELGRVSTDIRNWEIVQNVLSHKDTIQLVNDLLDEMTSIERELYYLSKIEQRTAVVAFLKLESYEELTPQEQQETEDALTELKTQKNELEAKYEEAKKNFGEKEQQTIELRKIGKILMSDAKCPLCGHEYESTKQLLAIIDNSVVVDDEMDALIAEIQSVSKKIMKMESILDRQKLIQKAKMELGLLADTVPAVGSYGQNYRGLYEYFCSKADKEKRKAEIVEQQNTLDAQGFSLKNINACKEYTSTDSTYLKYKTVGKGTYAEYLQEILQSIQLRSQLCQSRIADLEKKIQQNNQQEELLRNEIHRIDSILENLNVDQNRGWEQAVENIKMRFELPEDMAYQIWAAKYHDLYDKCELEVERLESQDSIAFEKKCLADYKATVKRDEPMVARCARAVQAFEKMPSLSSFVERGIRSNIQQISKFFKWMHHSGEFEELGIDEGGIYAIRGLNHEKIRTYQMSTGQRSTIAMAVMFTLHMAAPDAPQFLLLDEPLATMDDTQVLNVLDILKSMAKEQKTQIFFTTANGIMINLFKECFRNTEFDYKEYEFVKRVNRPSEIKEHDINDVKTIEELTLDDLTLDFTQFAQIREILRRNQERLVPKEEWEVTGDGSEKETGEMSENSIRSDCFLDLLVQEEKQVLQILHESCREGRSPISQLVRIANHKILIERINEKAMDFFGETIIDNDGVIPKLEEDYLDDLGL